MKIQPVGEKLKNFRTEHKKTLAFVAKRIEATSSYVSQLEHGVRNPSDSSLFDILTKAYELDKNTAEKLIRSWRINQYTSSDVSKMEEETNTIILPFYKDIDVSVDASKPVEMKSFYLEPELLASNYFLWEMNDESMEPNIPKGALLLICKNISGIPYHGIILTKIGEKLALRHYEKQPERIKLFAENHNFPVFFGHDVPIYGIVKKMLVDI